MVDGITQIALSTIRRLSLRMRTWNATIPGTPWQICLLTLSWIILITIHVIWIRKELIHIDDLFLLESFEEQEERFRLETMQEYLLHYGLRDIWIIHPPNRIDLDNTLQSRFYSSLLRYRIAASFDSGTVVTEKLCLNISRSFPDSNVWLLEDHYLDLMENHTLADIYGGWQSHLFCWKKIIEYYQQSRCNLPVLIFEDDIQPHPLILLRLSSILKTCPDAWSLLNLQSPTKMFGGAYVIHDYQTAIQLYTLNNLEKPPFVYSNNGAIIGWKPRIPENFSAITYTDERLVFHERIQTRYNHSLLFTPG